MPLQSTFVTPIFVLCFLFFSNNTLWSQNWDALSIDSLDKLYVQVQEKGGYQQALEIATTGRKKAEKAYGTTDSTYSRFTFFLASVLGKMGRFSEATPLYQEMLTLEQKIFGKDSPQYAIALHNVAIFYNKIGRFVEADQLLKICVPFFEKNKASHIEHYAKVYNTWGNIKMSLGEETLADEYTKKALHILEKEFGRTHPDYLFSMNNLAVMYSEAGRYVEAERLYLEVNELYGEVYGKKHPYYALSYNNLGGLFWRTGDYQKAADVYEEVLKRLDGGLPKTHPNYLMAESNLASMYENLGRFEESETIQLRVLKALEQVIGKQHPQYINSLNGLAYLYHTTDRSEEAIRCFKEELLLNEQVQGKNHPYYARNLISLASVYLTQKHLDTAKTLIEEAFLRNSTTIKTLSEIEYPLSEFILKHKFMSHTHLMGALNQLANIYKKEHQETNEIEALKNCLDALYTVVLYGESISNDFIENSDKLNIVRKMATAASKALEINAELQKVAPSPALVNMAFKLVDYNKSALLSQSLQANKARQLWTLPDSIVLQETALQNELGDLEQALVEAENHGETEKLKMIRQEMIRATQNKESFLKTLETDFPRYYAAQYASTSVGLDVFQKEILRDNQLLLEYFMDDTVLVVVAVSKEKKVFQFNWYSNTVFSAMITQFRKSLSDYVHINNDPNKSFQEYVESGYYLYQNCLQSILDSFEGINHLIIIPDGRLGHIPFEALSMAKNSSNEVDYTQIAYLIEKYSVSYSYSSSLLAENFRLKPNTGNNKILAFGATYKGKGEAGQVRANRSPNLLNLRDALQPLASVSKEIEGISDLFHGDFLYDLKANEKTFKTTASDYSVLHLAMHGILNTQYPIMSSLAFTENGDSLEDNFLHAYEISQMQLKANLVVLSACETGYGKFQQGEGVMSLARSFMYAGVPSLIVSLWQVNDQSTAIIMQDFYQLLSEGMPKDVALQQAKLNYVALAKGIAAHPAYWSPFIQLGDSRPIAIKTKGSGTILWGVIALLSFAFAGIVWYKRRKKEAV